MHSHGTDWIHQTSKHPATHLLCPVSMGILYGGRGSGIEHRLPQCIPHDVTCTVPGNLGGARYPNPHHCLIMHLLQAPHLFSVGQGYVPDIRHHPAAGTRQGDPLSLALFSLVSSMIIHPIEPACPSSVVLMYADDLIVFFLGAGDVSRLSTVLRVVREFAEFSGLRINLRKAAGIISNEQLKAWWSAMRGKGINVQHFIKYLGVRLGNIITQQQREDGLMGLTIEEVFSLAIQESFRRARMVFTLS